MPDRATRPWPSLVAAGLAIGHFACFQPGTRPLLTDVRYFLYFAWRTVEGDVPHLDLFDNKTQLATFLGAALFGAGEALGVEPLLAIRAGYLGLAALGAWLAFHVVRTLARGDAVAGFLGLAAATSFGLLGLMPSFGNVPKLAMSVTGTAMACCAYRGRWTLAGFLGALAFWDWQVGGVALVAALVTALATAPARRSACLRVVAGGALGVVPFAAYYALRGALGAFVDQVFVASLFRGTSALAREGVGARLERMAHLVEVDCPGRAWLFYASLAGAAVAAALLWRWRADERRRLLLPLVLFHLGVSSFSLLDFQWHGDLFSLMHSVVFFQGLLWLALWRLAAGPREERSGPRARIAAGVLLALAAAASRPGPLHAEIELELPLAQAGTTLADQREVAERLRPRFESERFCLVEFSELLFLLRQENPVPFVYWNNATWSRYRESADEEKEETLARLLRPLELDLVAHKRPLSADLWGARFAFEPVTSSSGRYVVYLQSRQGS